ncbi:hypothetical protein BQ8420_15090 [Nocardiopsis sp. JB363]|nr:hypothetical protein BQ8420_15090 [Nocardiopsis sp. JB363]
MRPSWCHPMPKPQEFKWNRWSSHDQGRVCADRKRTKSNAGWLRGQTTRRCTRCSNGGSEHRPALRRGTEALEPNVHRRPPGYVKSQLRRCLGRVPSP